ncbi:MAG: N-acetylmuramoyl-L-alanine amidase [Candidatus Riflebacteria bacterium]|nr:N-acetylmuramoyl-L-alanine amidase [Candidatus Riflebacteria bacterium]
MPVYFRSMNNRQILVKSLVLLILQLFCSLFESVSFAASVSPNDFSSANAPRQVNTLIASKSSPVVVLDPGHPSEVSSGDAVQNGVREVDINWDVALRLKTILEENKHCQVVLTRDQKSHLTTNRARAECANHLNAAIMLRLHCDTGSGRGFTYYFPDHEGAAGGKRGPAPEIIAESRKAAREIFEGSRIILATHLRDNGIKTDRETAVGGRLCALIGSIWSEVPVVTIEMVFLNNSGDASFIASPDGQNLVAEALASGIERYLATRRKE